MKRRQIGITVVILILLSSMVFSSITASAENSQSMNMDEIGLTPEEQAYLSEHKVLRFVGIEGVAPIAYADDEGEFSGIARHVMEYISNELDVEIIYNTAYTADELVQLVENREVDILFIPENYAQKLVPEIPLSQPFLTADTVLFYRSDLNVVELDDKICAVVNGGSAPPGVPKKNILYCQTRLEAVEKVNQKEADYGYGNAFSISYYIAQKNLKNVISLPVKDDTRYYCIGTVDGSPLMISALNKAIESIDVKTMQTLVLAACVLPDTAITFRDVIEEFAVFLVMFMLLLILIVLVVVIYINHVNKKLKMQNNRLVSLSEVSGELLFEYDIKTDQMLLFKKFREEFGIAEEKCSGDKSIIWGIVDLDSVIRRKITGEELEYPDGRVYQATYSYIHGKSAAPIYMLGKLVDISRQKAKIEELSVKAEFDGLTKILNSTEAKARCVEYMENMAENRKDLMLILDLDDFKSINDRFGHYTGDQVLVKAANNLKKTFMDKDIVGRLGGDEFIVYVPDIDGRDKSEEICREVLNNLQMQFCAEGEEYKVSVSIGAYEVKTHDNFQEVYKKADQALYKSKVSGKNRFYIYE